MIVYIDNDGRCHTKSDGTMIKIESDFFDDKCREFIEGYRVIKDSNSQIIVAWKPYNELAIAQHDYERNLLVEYKEELAVLDAALLDAQYNILVGGM